MMNFDDRKRLVQAGSAWRHPAGAVGRWTYCSHAMM
jgi:hypothetical protein